MQSNHAFHPELRHATVPTYVVSYLFSALIVIYEIYRVGYWVSQRGMNFVAFGQTGYEYALMLAVFAVQVVVDVLFLALVWSTRHPDFEHRLTNLALGLACSPLCWRTITSCSSSRPDAGLSVKEPEEWLALLNSLAAPAAEKA